ncbi:MAG TPA: chromosome segregation protein SMC, partial [Lachnospiraceae bacterium]|nr:chromosome segregation protein SMC [Lachnospiraceae bacterium]HBH69858.1 chromosome segregation protein SMC [Lachnospiraceae bacterium]
MYLKSIEIQGFKSFANKIKLEFHDGFTAIVGPNGSGKSNVGDAVRWVLGEQSAKSLRGGNMQDVIFAGTELRKPLSYAYVAITMDNSDHRLPTDYQEVTVARRLFRSGESEYLINGVQVRLRDVQELFYDTGIGKEGYSIIGQGQIEKILSDKPEDRRELFDEAVGIVKYKKRKNEAQKKLDNEKANLVRVNDIVAELQKQVGPLERQSEKARIYLKTMEELRHLDANIFLLENGKNKELLSEAGRKLQDTSAELSSASSEFEKVKEDYATAQTRLETLEKETEEARNRINDAGMVRSRLEGNIKVYREQISSAEKSSEHFHKRESDVRAQLAQRQKEQEAAAAGRQKTLDEIAALVQRQRGASENLTRLQEELS